MSFLERSEKSEPRKPGARLEKPKRNVQKLNILAILLNEKERILDEE